MIRHSKSQGVPLIYNEREGSFKGGTGHPFGIRTGKVEIAQVGEPLEYMEMSEKEAGKGVLSTSTKVTRIEVRKGLEAAVAKLHAETPKFINPAEEMRKAVEGRGKKDDE